MKQIMRALPALTLALLLSGCAAVPAESPEPTAVPTAESLPAEETAAPTPAESPAAAAVPAETPESAGTLSPEDLADQTYRYESEADGTWILSLKSNGTFSLICGEHIYTGEGWSLAPDGTVVTGPTEAAGAASFFDEFGSSVWRVDVSAGSCSPAG